MRRPALLATTAVLLASLAAAPAAQAARPGAVTRAATQVSPATAVLNGVVDPRGEVTRWFFQYGRTRAYGQRTAPVEAAGRSAVSAQVGNLQPRTTYHFRLVAVNASGRTNGGDRTFTTPRVPSTASIFATPNPVLYGRSTVLTGGVTGPNRRRATVVLEGNPFPFAGFQQVGNPVIADRDGNYSFTVSGMLLNTQFRVRARTNPPVVGPVGTVTVRPQLVARLSTTRPRRGGTVSFSGYVRPTQGPFTASVQRRSRSGRYRSIGRARLRPDGSVSRFRRSIRVRSTARFRVAVSIPSGQPQVSPDPSTSRLVRPR